MTTTKSASRSHGHHPTQAGFTYCCRPTSLPTWGFREDGLRGLTLVNGGRNLMQRVQFLRIHPPLDVLEFLRAVVPSRETLHCSRASPGSKSFDKHESFMIIPKYLPQIALQMQVIALHFGSGRFHAYVHRNIWKSICLKYMFCLLVLLA